MSLFSPKWQRVVADVEPHEPDQMTFAKDHDMLEELPTTAPDPALRCAVLPGTAMRDAVWLRTHRLDELDYCSAENRVVIKDEIFGRGVIRESVA